MGGVFVKKSVPFLNAGCIMYSISIFYFTFYLFGGAYPTHPLPTGLDKHIICFIIDGKHGYALCFLTCQG